MSQDLNVVLVAYPDALLDTYHAELVKRFPQLKFVKVPADLGKAGGYMDAITKAPDGLEIALLFNNAGFLTAGPFVDTPVARSLANLECNATCTVPITHHFVKKMVDEKIRGYVAFTSSSTGFVRE